MLKIRTISAALMATLFAAGASHAQSPVEKEEVGGWLVETQAKPTEKVNPLCVLYSPRESGTYLQITNSFDSYPTTQGTGYLRIYTDRLIPEATATLPNASINIDGKARWKADAEWHKAGDKMGALRVKLDDKVGALIRPLASGRELTLTVATPNGESHAFGVKLAGSSKALAVYEKCLTKVRVAPE